jgi:hypothetical protein
MTAQPYDAKPNLQSTTYNLGDFANDVFGSLSNTLIFFVSPPGLMRI